MTMTEWAENEVKIACERERGDKPEGEWDYGCACYESALKAYKCLMEDGHSGMSFSITKNILIRLMNDKPLTPIEDTPDMWGVGYINEDGIRTCQCKRMISLFKNVHPDGTVEYDDINRYICVEINNPDCTYHNSLVRRVIHEIFPITMPYIPEDKPYKVYCEEFLTDRRHGDFDTIGIMYVMCPDGSRLDIQRFFKPDVKGSDWKEIDIFEYERRSEERIR